MDMAKNHVVFLEESVEHLAEISRSLLDLEKDPARMDAIDLIFRMAHSIKGMAASLEYDSITEAAHRLEDRMQTIREARRVAAGNELAELFAHLEEIELLIGVLRNPGLVSSVSDGSKKKLLSV